MVFITLTLIKEIICFLFQEKISILQRNGQALVHQKIRCFSRAARAAGRARTAPVNRSLLEKAIYGVWEFYRWSL
jgi:hypothetical protein